MGAARRRAFWTIVGVTGLALPVAGQDSPRRETVLQALREQLPKYDEGAPSSVAPATAAREVAGEGTEAAATGALPGAAEGDRDVTALAPVQVTGTRLGAPPRPVRRLPTPRVQRDLRTDDFLSPAARDAILVKKHLSELDYAVLNRFHLPLVGASKEARARGAEQELRMAMLVNELSDFVEASARYGDAKETEDLAEEVQKIEMARPR